MQRRDFVKLPAVAVALPASALATTAEDDSVVVWHESEPLPSLFRECREAVLRVYKDGEQLGLMMLLSLAAGFSSRTLEHPNSGRIVSIDSVRRSVVVVGHDSIYREFRYDAVTVAAPAEFLSRWRDAKSLPRHWLKIVEEPAMRITHRETIVHEKSGRALKKIFVEVPSEVGDAKWSLFGSCYVGNAHTWYVQHDGTLKIEECYGNYAGEWESLTYASVEELLDDSTSDGLEEPLGWIEARWSDGTVAHVIVVMDAGKPDLAEYLEATSPASVVDHTT